tara:strand:- start:182 stop:583 length:402 start_codon:yes stop_codon:yes gene_type:complete
MSIIKKIKVFSSDDRGEISDIFSKESKDHCALVTFTKNAIRGNHFHKQSIQSAYVLNGSFKIFNVKLDKNFNYNEKNIEETEVTEGYYISHSEYEAHTYKCLSNSGTLIVFTSGVRGGVDYEKDTFRLKNNLV